MTFPQPAGYYGLQLSEEFEQKVSSFNEVALAQTNAAIAIYLNERIYEEDDDLEFDSAYLSAIDDKFIESLTNSKLIAFQRWICDRLAFLHTVPVQDIGYSAGFLSAEEQQKVNGATVLSLAYAVSILGDYIWQNHKDDDTTWLDITYPESDLDRLALIRGLCDRIEAKLKEAAK